MGLGGFYLVFPKTVLSQTISDEQLQPEPITFLTSDPAIADSLYQQWKAEKLVGKYGGQCVTFARNFTQATPNVVGGIAKKVKINTFIPKVGEIVKTDESKFGHLAVIIGLDSTNITIIESNYDWNGIIDIRTIPIQDPRIKGYLELN